MHDLSALLLYRSYLRLYSSVYAGLRVVRLFVYLTASSTATATATVAPTMGLLPMPRKPIIST